MNQTAPNRSTKVNNNGVFTLMSGAFATQEPCREFDSPPSHLCKHQGLQAYAPKNAPTQERTGFRREEINQPLYWPKVDKNGPIPAHRPELGPCWNWTACTNSRGYGCFAIHGRSFLTHRIAVVLDGRTIPDDLTVDHLCLISDCAITISDVPETDLNRALRVIERGSL